MADECSQCDPQFDENDVRASLALLTIELLNDEQVAVLLSTQRRKGLHLDERLDDVKISFHVPSAVQLLCESPLHPPAVVWIRPGTPFVPSVNRCAAWALAQREAHAVCRRFFQLLRNSLSRLRSVGYATSAGSHFVSSRSTPCFGSSLLEVFLFRPDPGFVPDFGVSSSSSRAAAFAASIASASFTSHMSFSLIRLRKCVMMVW